MSKNRIISIFYIFIIFNCNSLIKSCRDFHITTDMFNLNDIKLNKSRHVVEEKYNIQFKSFTYDYLEELDEATLHTLISFYYESKQAKSEEISLFGLLNFIKNNMRKLGFDIFSSEEELRKTKNIIEWEINKSSSLTTIRKNQLLEKLNDIDISYVNNEQSYSAYLFDTTVSVGSIAFSSVAVSYMNLALAPASLVLMSISLTISTVVSYFHNSPLEEKIKKNKIKAIRTSKMLEMLYFQIKLLSWEGNNVILTAVSNLDYCDKYDVMFAYDKEIKYNNWINTIVNMARRTCKLKENECKNKKMCRKNILEFVQCQNLKRKGKKNSCPYFERDDCSLEYYDLEYDL